MLLSRSRNTWGESNAWCSQLQGNLYSRNLAGVYRFSEEKANLIFRVHFPMSFRLVGEDGEGRISATVPGKTQDPRPEAQRSDQVTPWSHRPSSRIPGGGHRLHEVSWKKICRWLVNICQHRQAENFSEDLEEYSMIMNIYKSLWVYNIL